MYQNGIDMECISYYLSRTQGVCHVIHVFFGSSLGKV